MGEALRESLPKYDPAIRERFLAEEAAAKTVPPPQSTAPQAKKPLSSHPDGAIQLPEVVVEGRREKSHPLPRVDQMIPPGRVTIEPFASPAERDAKLIKRHMTAVDRALNRIALPLVGRSLESRAREAEGRAQYAAQLIQLATAIEYLESHGGDPQEIQTLRKLYMDLYLARPR